MNQVLESPIFAGITALVVGAASGIASVEASRGLTLNNPFQSDGQAISIDHLTSNRFTNSERNPISLPEQDIRGTIYFNHPPTKLP